MLFVFVLQAIATRDALAKCLYGALFDWIVLKVNHALLAKRHNSEHQVDFPPAPPCTRYDQPPPYTQASSGQAAAATTVTSLVPSLP